MVTREHVREILKGIDDPELGFSIVDLGLVYNIALDDHTATVEMTLTTPTCPLQDHFRSQIEAALKPLPGITAVSVVFVFEPRWTIQKASDSVKEQLALRGLPIAW